MIEKDTYFMFPMDTETLYHSSNRDAMNMRSSASNL